MRINELVENIEQINELGLADVGRGIGKAATAVGQGLGGAVGGTIAAAKNFGSGVKQGYQGAGSAVSGAAPQTAPQAASAAPGNIRALIAQKKQELADLEKQVKSPNQPGIGQASNPVANVASNTAAPQAAKKAPTATPPTEPGIGQAAGSVQATSSNTTPVATKPAPPGYDTETGKPLPADARFDPNTGKPLPGTEAPTPADIRQQKQAAAAKVAQDQMAANTAPAAPAPAAETPPTGTAPAPQTGGKMTAAQQAALKAKLQGQRQAGKTTASQTGSGFKDYVGGSQNKIVVNPDGSTSLKKLQRESVEFYSNFLGRNL
jgi:hypothetical protein